MTDNVENKLDQSLDDIIEEDRSSRRNGRSKSSERNTPYDRDNNNSSNSSSNRVYVGNLDYRTSWQDLKDHMKQAGTVNFADVFVMNDGRSRGCGIVEFATAKEAQNAIRTLHDSVIPDSNGRQIFVREDREAGNSQRSSGRSSGRSFGRNNRNNREGGGKQGRQLFVGNLPYETSWHDLKDFFKQCGTVEFADIEQNYNGRSKGSGIVVYTYEEDAKKAIRKLHDKMFNGRPLIVKLDKFA